MRSPEGVQTNAVFGFVNILFSLLNKHKPDYMAVAFDRKGPTFRHKEYTAYKATRTKAPDELYAQIPIVKDLATTFKIPSFEVEGFEADDILATIVTTLKDRHDLQILIATGDFDLFQIATDNASILYPTKSFKDADILSVADIQTKHGILPTQIPDYKGLAGDSSDNIPGVRGIGPKTAVQLLTDYKTIEGIYENIENIPSETIKNKLLLNKENAFLSKRLATLIHTVPMNFNLPACHIKSFDAVAIRALFDRLGFKSLKKRLDEQYGAEPIIDLTQEKAPVENSQSSLFE